jgi:hypothetical protein
MKELTMASSFATKAIEDPPDPNYYPNCYSADR